MNGRVYLDYNATAPLRPEAKRAVVAALEVVGNPSSVHGPGRAARRIVEEARERVAALVGARAEQVVFTGGGSEANALALRGFAPTRTLTSAVEHDSVLANAPNAATVPVDHHGLVDLDALRAALAEPAEKVLISVMAANNETGVIQPLAQVTAIARSAGARVHCDAIQAAGKAALDMDELGADLMTLSAHKLGGPPGVGAMVVSDGIDIAPLIRGGGQERRRRAGTENVPGIAGFGAAAEAALREIDRTAALSALRDDLERRLAAACAALVIPGAGAPRLTNTSCIALPGLKAETQVMALDLAGIAVSAGAACSSGKVAPSHVLRAMGLDDATVGSAIRVSLGWDSRVEDIDRFIDVWQDMAARAGRRADAA